MPKASIKKIIPCKKNDLIEMILDIEKYPHLWIRLGQIGKAIKALKILFIISSYN